jgi:2-succinyl-6-hydroxy-2,4-cyclohexadiene-1-carboxylate synthase
MGGRIALHAALAFPERISHLILIGASPGIAERGARTARRIEDEHLAGRIERMDIESFAREWASKPIFAGQPADVAAAVHADRLRNQPIGLAAALRGLGTSALPPVWGRLRELAMPVRLVAGSRDRKFTEIAARMARGIADSQVAIISEAGHAAHLEAPERLASIIAAAVADESIEL